MKIAISAVSEDLKQPVNPVFGRCNGFVIAETGEKELKKSSFAPNPAMSAGMGSGIAAAQAVAEQGAEAVITGNVGPNAFMVLQKAGIKVYQANGLSVEQAIAEFNNGKLKEIKSSNVAGHFGMGRGFGRGAGRERAAGSGAGRGRAGHGRKLSA